MQLSCLVFTFIYLYSNVGAIESTTAAQLLLKSSTNGEGLEIIGNQCQSGVFFQSPERFTCTCLTGMWAFYSSWCTVPITIIGGIDYCQQLNDMQLAQVSLLTSNVDTSKPTLTRVSANVKNVHEVIDTDTNVYWNTKYSSFITSGSGLNGWTVTFTTGDKSCLVHNSTTTAEPFGEIPSYCFFDNIGDNKINDTKLGCDSEMMEQIHPVYCANFVVGDPSDRSACFNETEFGPKIKSLGLNRLKRMENIPNYDAGEVAINETFENNATKPTDLGDAQGQNEKPAFVEEKELDLQLDNFQIAPLDNDTDSIDLKNPKIDPDFVNGTNLNDDDPTKYPVPDIDGSNDDSTDDYIIPPTDETTVYPYPDTTELIPTSTEYEFTTSTENELIITSTDTNGDETVTPDCRDENNPECDPPSPKDEDSTIHSVKNNPVILNHLCSHVEIKIGEVVGTRVKVENQRTWPTVRILEQALEIMRRTCKAVPIDYLDMALETFKNVQIHSLHLKEPFISHPAHFRIKKALENCLVVATPHQFVNGNRSLNFSCENNERKPSSNQINRDGKIINLELPEDKSAKGFEPIIETIWKVLVNTHSYCFKHFSDYFNDHHTFTVALMPFFNNEIQKIWMPPQLNGTYIEPGENLQLYGGLIGDHRTILTDVDNCVAASRVGSAYPWYMNRPPKDESNKWRRRKKRSIAAIEDVEEEEENQYCLKSPDDPIQLFSLEKCN